MTQNINLDSLLDDIDAIIGSTNQQKSPCPPSLDSKGNVSVNIGSRLVMILSLSPGFFIIVDDSQVEIRGYS